MRKIPLVLLAAGIFGLLICWSGGFAASVDREVEATPLLGFTRAHGSVPSGPLGRGEIDECTEIRAVLGSPGKNIVASWTGDGDTVQVLYGRPNPEPHVLLIWYAHSFDGGASWELASSTVGPGAARRTYPGMTQLRTGGDRVPYLAWHQAYQSGGSYVRSPLYFTYDEFYPYMLFTPRCINPADSATLQLWLPSITMSDDGDTILMSGGDIQWPEGVILDGYLYRSVDGGATWGSSILMLDTQGNNKSNLDTPLMHMAPGGYVFAYFEWADAGSDRLIPFYTESTDYGATWSTPDSIGVPYVGATGWWYAYDMILDRNDNNRPHVALKFSPETFEFSDIWELHPYSGSPGSWSNWQYTLLMGDANGGQRLATQPSIGMLGGTSNIYVTFSYFSDTTSGQLDIGMRCSTDGGQTWDSQIYQITDDMVAEEAVELAYDVSNYLHIVYLNDRDAPTRVMHLRYANPHPPGVEESAKTQVTTPAFQLYQNEPNPFSGTTGISYHLPQPSDVSMRVYDLSGKVVRTLVDETRGAGFHRVIWDGRGEDGSEAPSGIYFYRLSAGSYRQARKLVVVR